MSSHKARKDGYSTLPCSLFALWKSPAKAKRIVCNDEAERAIGVTTCQFWFRILDCNLNDKPYSERPTRANNYKLQAPLEAKCIRVDPGTSCTVRR